MRLAMIGLGRMGGDMARRLLRGGHEVAAFDLEASRVGELVQAGVEGAATRGVADAAGGRCH